MQSYLNLSASYLGGDSIQLAVRHGSTSIRVTGSRDGVATKLRVTGKI
jgi:hypothetical protein